MRYRFREAQMISQANSFRIPIAIIADLCYNISAETNVDRGVLLLNAINSSQYLLWAKRPLLGGFTSRRSSQQRWQPSKGRFVMTENQRPCPSCSQPMHRQSKMCWTCFRKVRKQIFIEKICPVCKKPFKVDVNQVKYGNGIYCSKSCKGSGSPSRKRERVRVQCASCQKDFDKRPIEVKRNKGDLHFCTPECWYEHNTQENHYGYTGTTPERQAVYSSRQWKRVAFQVWQRDNAECQRCQAKKRHDFNQLDIHHIVPFSKSVELRCDINNLVLLCDDCHKWVHSNDNVNREFLGEI